MFLRPMRTAWAFIHHSSFIVHRSPSIFFAAVSVFISVSIRMSHVAHVNRAGNGGFS
jgi:hypothetical protein